MTAPRTINTGRAEKLRGMRRGIEKSRTMDPVNKVAALFGLKLAIEALDPPKCASRDCDKPCLYGQLYCKLYFGLGTPDHA